MNKLKLFSLLLALLFAIPVCAQADSQKEEMLKRLTRVTRKQPQRVARL